MSLYVQHQTVMNDSQCLVKVLRKHFKEVELHNTPQPLIGYGSRKAEIIVRRKYLTNSYGDIGFLRNSGTGNFAAITSDDDRKYGKKWLQDVSKDYLVEKANALMADQESDLLEQETLQDGSIRLTYRVPVHA